MKTIKRVAIILFIVGLIASLPLAAQQTLESGMNEVASRVRNIGSIACGIIGALIGLIALARAAWKFSQGEPGAVMSLLEGIIAIALAQVAAGFFAR